MSERLSFLVPVGYKSHPEKPRHIKTPEQIAEWLLSRAEQHGDCLISHLATNAKGYIPVSLGGRRGKKYRAHRLICEVVHGPSDLLALHTCHVRNCLNPKHLYWGTAAQNTDDMLRAYRGRNQSTYTFGRR